MTSKSYRDSSRKKERDSVIGSSFKKANVFKGTESRKQLFQRLYSDNKKRNTNNDLDKTGSFRRASKSGSKSARRSSKVSNPKMI
jgi:hypothetical protein